jgi:xanthine dehydrogenase YagS FAD-binding subunit
MNLFDYVRASSVDEAVAAVAKPGARILAGGTNLLDLMKIGVAEPTTLVDITRLEDLKRIDWLTDGDVRIGSLVRNSDLAYETRFATAFPMVAEALLSGASAQLRNAATAGGNLLQKTRCSYYQDVASACNRRNAGSGCDARHGLNRLHAVLGWSDHCIATHPSDFCVPLAALEAMVEVTGKGGIREIPIESFHLLPGDQPAKENALEAGELVTAIRIPADASRFAAHSRYLKLRERTSYAFALVSAAAAMTIEDGRILEARLTLGAIAAKPWRSRDAEAAMIGQMPSKDLFHHAAGLALQGAIPSGDNAFKIELAGRLAARALSAASAGTPAAMPALPGSPLSTFSGDAHVA